MAAAAALRSHELGELRTVYASVRDGAATFLDFSLARFSESWAAGYTLERVFYMFVAILVLTSLANIFSSHLLAIFNNISVWWHVAGATIVVLILIFGLKDGATHWNVTDVFTGRVNNTGGLNGGSTDGPGYWFYVLPLGFLLTQYTITGYDASAHLSEETHSAADSAAKGIWRSIFYSAIGGWILLLSFLYAVQDVEEVTLGGGFVNIIFSIWARSSFKRPIHYKKKYIKSKFKYFSKFIKYKFKCSKFI